MKCAQGVVITCVSTFGIVMNDSIIKERWLMIFKLEGNGTLK